MYKKGFDCAFDNMIHGTPYVCACKGMVRDCRACLMIDYRHNPIFVKGYLDGQSLGIALVASLRERPTRVNTLVECQVTLD